jgi:GT2 family glycosyltransferase
LKPEVSAIVVNHRSAAEARHCVASLSGAFAHEGVAGEIVLVDCGSGPEEAEALRALPADTKLLLPENRGYSGGLNAGMARTQSPRLILCNADVVFLPGAVTALLEEIADPRVGAAAPLCVWDAAGKLSLPADAGAGFLHELGRSRFPSFARRTLSLWDRGGEAKHLVGAVLAARRDVFDRVGRFDERFLFEYEETEWEDRVRRAGLSLRFVPRARVRHLFARSSARNPDTERRRALSRRLYRERRWGPAGRWLLERAGRRMPSARAVPIGEPRLPARAGAWVAISTNPSLVPFAGAPLSEDFRLPPEVLESLPPGPVYLRAFRARDGQPLETFVWERP